VHTLHSKGYKRVRKRNVLMVVGAVAAALALAAPAAVADPSGNPTTRVLVGVGSDTTQDVLNALSNVPASGSRTIGSFDATGASPLPATKGAVAGSDCTGLARPVGSGNGVAALRNERTAAAAANRRPCFDFARSSANQSQDAANAGFGLTWIPFAGDQVTYVTRRDSALPTTLSTAQLAAIYNCTAAGTISNPPTILPLLPQAGSGTRSFFLASIGVTTPGACVSSADPTNPANQLIENSGDRLTDPRYLVPYSVAQFNSQYYKSVADVRGVTEMRRANGTLPNTPTFSFKREVFNVVPTSELGDPAVSSVFVGADNPTDICNQTDVITRFGFTALAAGRCGQIDPLLQSSTGGPSSGDLPGPVA
jgi:ABC-type phosphate transport system substrate-binding protein